MADESDGDYDKQNISVVFCDRYFVATVTLSKKKENSNRQTTSIIGVKYQTHEQK
jgi:hypothetical protein